MRSLVVTLQEAYGQSRVPVEIPWIDCRALLVNALQTERINMRKPAITALYPAMHQSTDMETIEHADFNAADIQHRVTA